MPKNVNKYDKERLDILNKMFNILGLGEGNNKFSLHKLDKDIEKQKAIIDLEGEIKKYFVCGKWGCFIGGAVKRIPLSIVRYTLKNMGYDIISSRQLSKDDPTQRDTIYTVIKTL